MRRWRRWAAAARGQPWPRAGGGAKHETHGGRRAFIGPRGMAGRSVRGVRRGRGGPCGPPRCRKPLARFAGGGRGGQLAEADGGDVQDGRGCRGYALRFPPEGRQGHDGFPVFFGKGIDKGIQGRRGCRCVAANFRSVHVCCGSLFRYATSKAGTVPNMFGVRVRCVMDVLPMGARRRRCKRRHRAGAACCTSAQVRPCMGVGCGWVLVVWGAGGVPRCRRCT